ncbi:FMN-dependent NADH-azoreductase [Mesorhizobium albiziae]|uniref:FMN dependent NADH:quinone oxidoreductase n=1 Tax=Neomesorhizobium albiziae TaxID=335020 RepID=A0A1I4FR22_9HYPH|nr:FMN-dependent NADH-azoreductase [Mesorhizobium albiziae]GLS28458.1 FMN-dependent NADH-azoreductase [Mesorhizobium albiziae]SFL19276.1 FMN-dependent NADH-azoreductase [Mesorhizobium albiziae]
MPSLLHLDSSILGENSVSRALSAAVVARLQSLDPMVEVVYRDLAAQPIPHLSGNYVGVVRAGMEAGHDAALKADLALGTNVLDEFLAADTVVLGVAQYNFSVPSQMKAWIDRIAVPGKTFRYTEKGPEGVVGSKRVIIALARGGFYGPGSPAESFEHTLSYLKSVFAFIGIRDPEVITADGVNISAEQRKSSLKAAQAEIGNLAIA